jgi:Zn-dependent M28 family amino/carboxypeptidase
MTTSPQPLLHPARPAVALLALLAAALAFSSTLRATEPQVSANTERQLRAHVTYLADDLLEGRGAGTRGHGLAMLYVSAQFARLGIEPAGDDGGFQQKLSMRESRLDLTSGRLVIRAEGVESALVPVNDMIARPAAGEAESTVTAPALFVGFGIHAPEFGYDDFANGVDVRGKIAVILAGSPASLPSTAKAHYSREKIAELARRGAAGIVTLDTPAEEKRRPWAFVVNSSRFPSMRLINADGSLFEAYPEIRAAAHVSRAASAALFARTGTSYTDVIAASERSEAGAFPLNIELTLSARAETSDTTSANVLGWLPGTDPALAGEPLVVTGHLDHLGIGPALDGDAIYNGAIDNALGTAVLLAAAEQLASKPRLRRPVLFASLTAEEKGLLGASHLARHPPVRVQRYNANLNIDMPVILGPTRDVIGIGAEHSTLGAALASAASRTGFTVTPDPQPEEVVFVRSDQYPFVRAGVPALFMKAGQKSLDPAFDLVALEADFRKTYYHKPGDDLTRPIHWASAAAFAELQIELIREIANNPVAPTWLPGDFFGTRFGKKP